MEVVTLYNIRTVWTGLDYNRTLGVVLHNLKRVQYKLRSKYPDVSVVRVTPVPVLHLDQVTGYRLQVTKELQHLSSITYHNAA